MDVVFIIGRIILGALLVMSGLNHFTKMDAMVQYSKGKKVPMPGLAVAFTGLMLLFAGVAIIGWWSTLTIPGLIVLAVFLFFTTMMMHAFWKETDPGQKMSQMHYFMGNMMLLGATLIMMFFA